jgi:hypothetical protein
VAAQDLPRRVRAPRPVVQVRHTPGQNLRGIHMTEDEYFASEFTDDFLNSQADAGDRLLAERNRAEATDHAIIFLKWIRSNFDKGEQK